MGTDPFAGATTPEPWSLALGAFGRGCVVSALVLAVASIVLWLLASEKSNLLAWAKFTFSLSCVAFFGAFASVATLFVTDQFQYKYVFEHGAKNHQLRFKIAGTWSGQEGSILLWGTASALFGLISARATADLRKWFSVIYAAFLGLVAAILTFESPFTFIPLVDGKLVVPTTGQGLNASLMNYWVVIHPPTIFCGFGSLTVLFAWSVAALIKKDLQTWIYRVRPWALVSVTLLGVGLAMGGFWAYETLGWGGFWMWDPVENTSFVPWVAALAFVHGIFVQISRQKWYLTNALLAAVPFILFAYGTFLTRSGFLGDTSVHSFANMNRSALWFLVVIILGSAVGFLGLWGWRSKNWSPPVPEAKSIATSAINRQALFGLGVWLLVGFGVVTALGMSVPFFQTVMGQKPKVVEEQLYNTVLSFFYLPLTLIMAVAPFVTWRGRSPKELASKFVNIFAVSIGIVGMALLWVKGDWHGLPADMAATVKLLLKFPVPRVGWVMVLSFFSVFGIVAAVWKLIESFRKSMTAVGAMLAHVGVSVALLGLIFSRGMEQKQDAFVITDNKPVEAFHHNFLAVGPTSSFIDPENKVKITVDPQSGAGKSFTVEPGLYFNGIDDNGQPTPMIWPAIYGAGLYDLYLVVHNITFEASGPTDMKQGDQRLVREENMLVTYNKLRTEGPLGQNGATFIADVTVATPEGQWNVSPMLKMTNSGLENFPAKVGTKWKINLVRINAADKSATLQVLYVQPAYIAELFYKPLTLFVWLGIGIMTVGGGLTAWARRFKPSLLEPKVAKPEPGKEPESQK